MRQETTITSTRTAVAAAGFLDRWAAHDWRDGLVPGAHFALAATAGAELFFVLYFFTTGLHAVHLAIGIVMIGAFARGVRRPSSWAHAPRLQAAALYWHFVDVVWIVLYPLLYLVGRSPA